MIDFASIILTVFGLALFEVITSIDNAVINAEVLSTMGKKMRKWFLTWGLIIAVFLLRGLLPFLIVWLANTNLSIVQVLSSTLSSDPAVIAEIKNSSAVLLIGGGVFLLFLFLNWLFMEPKNYGLRGESFFYKQSIWFYAVVSIILSVIVWMAMGKDPVLGFGAVLGSTAFFITHGFKQNAESKEESLLGKGRSDLSKLFYLEVIDASFSIDGVLGAFAFTFVVPLILIGNGIGAFAIRQITVSNIERVKKYKYLKNGAMYSVFALGTIMILDSFGHHIPEWLSPILTLAIVGYFYLRSRQELKNGIN